MTTPHQYTAATFGRKRRLLRPSMVRAMRMHRVYMLLLFLLLPLTLACFHATGHFPSGPPPEYEEPVAPAPAASATAATARADAGSLPVRPAGDAVVR